MKYQEMNSPSLAGLDRQQTLVVIPIAAVEQHGPHMPTGTDTILCTAVAEALESRSASSILLTPTVWFGASSHHLRLGSTFDVSLDVYINTLCDLAGSVLDDGFKRLLFLNGHGGNMDPMKVALRKLQPSYLDSLLVAGNYWSVAEDTLELLLEGDSKQVGHACEAETSLMMHLRPDLVDRTKLSDAGSLVPDELQGLYVCRDMVQRTRDGFTGHPELASAEKGKRLFDCVVERLAQLATCLLEEPLATS